MEIVRATARLVGNNPIVDGFTIGGERMEEEQLLQAS